MEKPDLIIDEELEKVFLNGYFIGNLEINDPEDGFYLLFREVNKLAGVKILDIFNERISGIRILFEENFYYQLNGIFSYYTHIMFSRGEISYINIHLELDNWDFQFGIHSFFKKLTKSLNDVDCVYINEEQFENFEEIIRLGLNIYLTRDVWYRDVLVVHNELVELLKAKIENIFLELSKENNLSLSNTFIFPPEIQSSCEQYLIYFATFLKDIGINAETNIESKAHETLFTVIPKDGEEALGKIREALQVYLSLPASPEFESMATEFPDVGVQQLLFQVNNFKSQLMYAKATIQLKDEIIQSKQISIESLKLTNFQQKEIIQSHQNKKENEEEIAGGLIKAKEVKGPGFTINLPELLRRIKRKFQ